MKKPTSNINAFSLPSRAVAISAAALALTSAVQAALLINEGFESPTWNNNTVLTTTATNGWLAGQAAVTDGTVSISSADAHLSTQSLFLMDNANGYTATARYTLSETVEAGSLEFWAKKATDYNVVNYRVDFLAEGGSKVFDFVIYNPGAQTSGSVGQGLYIRNNSGVIVTGVTDAAANFVAGNWNHFGISFDKATGSLNVTLNSVTVLSLTAAQISQISDLSVKSIAFNAGWNNSAGNPIAFYLDDVMFETPNVPEPSTWAIVGGLCALGFAFRLRRRRT